MKKSTKLEMELEMVERFISDTMKELELLTAAKEDIENEILTEASHDAPTTKKEKVDKSTSSSV